MPRRTSSTDQLPLFGEGLAASPVPAPAPLPVASTGGPPTQVGTIPATADPGAAAPEGEQPRPLPPHPRRCATTTCAVPVEGDALFHAWSYNGFALTPAERLLDARARFAAIYGVPPTLIAVPVAEVAIYAGLDPLVEAHKHTPAQVLWLLVPQEVRGRRAGGRNDGGDE
jgi:hypothetical protein